MKTNLDEQLKWLRTEYVFNSDPIIIEAKDNLSKLYRNSIETKINNIYRQRGEPIGQRSSKAAETRVNGLVDDFVPVSFDPKPIETATSTRNDPEASSTPFTPGKIDRIIHELDDINFSEDITDDLMIDSIAQFDNKLEKDRVTPIPEESEDEDITEIESDREYLVQPDSDPFEPTSYKTKSSKPVNSCASACMTTSKCAVDCPSECITERQATAFPFDSSLVADITFTGSESEIEYISEREFQLQMKSLLAEKAEVSVEICDLMEQCEEDPNGNAQIRLTELRKKRCWQCYLMSY